MNLSTQIDCQSVNARKVNWFTTGSKTNTNLWGRSPSFLLVLLFGLLSVCPSRGFGQSICPDISKCNAQDVKIKGAFVADANGQPIKCVTGTTVNAYLYIVVSSNATRQGLRFAGTITIGNGSPQNIGHCFPQSLKGSRGNVLKYPTPISWTCGTPVTLSNVFIAWSVGQTNICNQSLTCDQYSPQCYTQPATEVIQVEIKPLGVAINYGSPDNCSASTNKTINFTSSIINGTTPYTYEWDFGDDSPIDNTANPAHQYSKAGTYTVTLNVTDATGKTGSSTQIITVGECCTGSVMPTSITASPGSSICAGTQVTLTQQGGSLGTNADYKWYTGSCGETLVGTGNSITVTPTTTTTYYVRAEGTCGPTNCQQITITVNQQPTQPAKVNCWDNYVFNTTSCTWVNEGTQPTQPATACHETATFNTSTCSWNVTVTDVEKPVVTAANDAATTTSADDAGDCDAVVAISNAAYSDNCSVSKLTWAMTGATIANSLSTGINQVGTFIFNKGVTTITYTVTDAAGLTSQDVMTVTVTDDEKPTISAPANISTGTTDAGLCTKSGVSVGTPTVTDNCSATAEGVRSDGLALTAPYPFGTTTITWTATDAAGLTATATQTITIDKVKTVTTVTVSPTSRQYSDKVTFTATVAPANCTDAGSVVNAASIVTFKVGEQTMGSAPVGADGVATLSDVALLEGVPGQMAPSSTAKTVTATFSGYSDYLTSTATTGLTITAEDACTDYNGQTSISGVAVNKTTSKATIPLSVGLEDKSDGSRGDIRNAIVEFKLEGYNPAGSVDGWFKVPVKSLNADNTIGNASVVADVTFGGAGTSLDFAYRISGYYQIDASCSPDNGRSVITVYLPQNEFITGGGYIKIGSTSVGQMPAGNGSRANFGFNVKYTRKGTQLQGNINYIFRKFEESDQRVHVYQVKGNSMTNLSVGSEGDFKTAVFNGKCNLTDLTTGLAVDGTGNSTMQVILTDKGEPGTNDEYGITIWKSDGTVLHSNNWISTKTVKQTIARGNIVVHNGSATAVTPSVMDVKDLNFGSLSTGLTLNAFPNPANSHFILKVESNNTRDAITLKVYNQLGQVVDVKRNLFSGQVVQVGAAYKQGTYFVEVTQGTQKQNLQLVKTN